MQAVLETGALSAGDVDAVASEAAAAEMPGDSVEVVYDWNLVTDEITWGPGLASVLDVQDIELLSTGLGYAEHLAAESPSSRYEAIMTPGGVDAGGGVVFKVIYGLVPAKRSSAPPVWIEDSGRWFADSRNRPSRAHGAIRVITKRFERERQAAASAQRDEASGAYTRAFFVEHVARQLSLSARKTSTFAVLLLELKMEPSSDLIDDAAMAGAVGRLRAEMRTHEVLARHAPSKLAVLLEGCNKEQTGAAAMRFIATLGQSAEGALALKIKAGAVIAPWHGRTPQALLQFAEEALDVARQPGRPDFFCYEPGLVRSHAAPAMQVLDEVVAALQDGRIVLALQPIVDAKTRSVALYEGLARIKRGDGTLITPDSLVPVAEKNGLMPLLDRRAIELAFSLLTADRKLALSINASVSSLKDPGWLDNLRSCSRRRPDAARRLTIEITETRAMADVEETRAVLTAIKPMGVKIAIDDFGSGHSSFRNLRDLPIDYLKIDGAFAQNLANSRDDRFFIRTLIELARNLRIPTIAEWVEDEATATILAEWGVHYLQGHLFGKAELAASIGTPAHRAGIV